jgi:hypothetical protein
MIGTSKRRPLTAQNNTPGPNYYNIIKNDMGGPKHFMGGTRTEIWTKSDVPGPGEYDQDNKAIY